MKSLITNNDSPLTMRKTQISRHFAALAAGGRAGLLKLSLACAVAALLVAAPNAFAGVLVQYALPAVTGVLPQNTAANMSAGNVTTNFPTAWNNFTTTAVPWVFGPNNNTATIAQAISGNQFFSVTLSPNSGYALSVTNLTFYVKRGGGTTRGYTVRSSLDSYATDLGTNLLTTTVTQYTVTNSSAFTNLLSPVTFRLYWFADSVTTAFTFSNLTFNGYVAASAAPPGVPTGLAAIAGNNQVALSWTAAVNDVTYNVYRSTSSGGTYTKLVAGTGISTTTFTDTTAVNGTPYFYEVTALNLAAAESAPTAYVAATPVAPAAVPTFTVVTPGVNQVTLSWSTSSGATGYNLKRSTTSGSGYVTVTNNISTTNFTDTTALYGGVTYYYVVSSLVATTPNTVESANSAQTNAVPTGVSAVPAGLTAAADVNQVNLAWSATAGATSYNVYRGTSTGAESYLANASGTAFADTTAVGGTKYFYYITGTNIYAESAASAEVSTTPYIVPVPKLVFHFDDSGTSTYSDTNGGGSNVVLNLYSPFNLTATPVLTDFHTASGVGVAGGKALGFTGTNVAATGLPGAGNVSSNLPNPTTANLAFGTLTNWTASIWFEPTNNWTAASTLVAFGANGYANTGHAGVIGITWSSSNAITVVFDGNLAGSPTAVAVLSTNIPINQWSLVTASYDGTNFNVYYGTATSASALVTNVTAYPGQALATGNTNGWASFGALGDGTIPYKGYLDEFRFYAGASGSAFAENIRKSAFTSAAPSNLAATPGAGQVSLTWTPPAVASATAVTYNIKRSTNSAAETTLPLGTNYTGTSFTDLTALGGVTYYYVVSAVTFDGESTNSQEKSVTPTLALPSAPATFTVVPSNGVVFLNWSLSAGAATYNIYRATISGAETNNPVSVANPTSSYADTNLTNGVTYYYEITAVSGAGESLPTAELTATPNVPSAVPVVTATANANNTVTLSWSAVANTSLTTPLTYNVYRSTVTGTEVLFTNLSAAGFIDPVAYNGATYYYKVTSLNGNGESAKSTEVYATPTGVPLPPTNLSPVAGATNVALSWTASIAVATGYNVYRGLSSGTEAYYASVAGTAFNDTNVSVGTTYYYYVTGTNIYGEGLASAETNAIPYGIPALAIQMPFDETNTGSDYFTTNAYAPYGYANIYNICVMGNDTNNLTLTNIDLHGAAGSGVGGVGAALDYSSRTNQGGAGQPAYATYDKNDANWFYSTVPAWTASMWFKPTVPFGTANADLFVVGIGTTAYAGQANAIGLRSIGTNVLAARVNNGTDLRFTLPAGLTANAWHFVALSYDGFTLRTYLGSDTSPVIQIGTNTIAGSVNFSNTVAMMFGNNINSYSEVFAGFMDDFRFYTGPSDSNYVETIRQSGIPTVAPTVTVNPASTNVQCGSTLSLTTSGVSGTPPLAYQWYDYASNPIANATNITLTLTNVHPSQNGNYSVIVTNSLGSATNFCTLTVTDTVPPVITLNGNNPTTVILGTAYTDAGATAVDACDGSVSVTTSNGVNTAVAGTYTVTYTANDGVNYATNTRTVNVVTNYLVQLDFGTPPSTVPTPPGFTKITMVNYAYGTNVTFANVAGSGYTLTFTNIRAYTANGATFETDGFLFPSANTPPYLPSSSFNLSGLPTNSQVTIYSCWGWDSSGHAANFTYAGLTNQLTLGNGITNPGTNNLQNIGTMVANASGTVGGTITGAARNAGQEGEFGGMIFFVQIASAPTATISPATATVECSKSTNLTAVAVGAGPLTYQWYDYNDSPIANATNVTLTLTNLHGAQSGNYYVTVANLAGSVTATNTVVVQDTTPPVITANTNMTIYVPYGYPGTNAYYTVVATDACSGSSVTTGGTPASGSFFALGTNTVNTYAIDTSANTNTGTFKVIIVSLPPPLSTNAYLTSLVFSPSSGFAPAFTSNVLTGYNETNAYGDTPTVTVTNADPTATNTLIVNGVSLGILTNSTASVPLSLGIGSTNVVAVQVVSQDLSVTNTYVVDVTEQALSLSTNAYLTSLVFSPSAGFAPAFTSNVLTGYNETNAYGDTPTVTVTNADLTATNTLIVNGVSLGLLTNGIASAQLTLGVGSTNVLSVQVVSQDLSATNNYVVDVTRLALPLSTNALLAGLSISPGALSQTFSSGTTNYTATNSYSQNPVTVTATSADVNATLALSFTNGAYGVAVTNSLSASGNSLQLNPPVNTVAVRVVSQDLSQTNVYTVAVLLQPSQTVPHLTNSVSGNSLVLNWAADHLGYRLLVQTNNLNKGVSGNTNDWATVANSTSITATNIAIIKAGVTNEYYKLVYP